MKQNEKWGDIQDDKSGRLYQSRMANEKRYFFCRPTKNESYEMEY